MAEDGEYVCGFCKSEDLALVKHGSIGVYVNPCSQCILPKLVEALQTSLRSE